MSAVWVPDENTIQQTHIAQLMKALNIATYPEFHRWSVTHYEDFWQTTLQKLNIVFQKPYSQLCDLRQGIAEPHWLVDAKLNIAESCFKAPSTKTAIFFQAEDQPLQKMTYAELNQLSNRVANSLVEMGISAHDTIAIVMPMNSTAVAIYLGILKMGGVVVSIADSFSAEEIATRLRITQTKLIFTQDKILRQKKFIPLYEKIVKAKAPSAIVVQPEESTKLRPTDIKWDTFLVVTDQFKPVPLDPMTPCHILFSSGTTADPKAIPWNATTMIKAASDAYYHHDIHAEDILAWPTSLGWMMGPWLVFAALINNAAMALYEGTPNTREFGEFIQNTPVTMLGVVPTLVLHWKQTQCMEGLDWRHIKKFSSTGECSNPDDMSYLMSLADNKPIIEYCGGTEIGGGYITSTMVEKNYPSLFSTPALGIDFILLNEQHLPAEEGEVALIPPSFGLSTSLLNADHFSLYFAGMPMYQGKMLRRHGDEIRRLANGYYCLLGRADDAINLSGIKISSAEIERAIAGIDDIGETAAIAISPADGGPSQLVIYATTRNNVNNEAIKTAMQQRINTHLNPLFKIHDVVFVTELPKTASNKIMRKSLRALYSR